MNWDNNKRVFISSNVKNNQHKNRHTNTHTLTFHIQECSKLCTVFVWQMQKPCYYHTAFNIIEKTLEKSLSIYFISDDVERNQTIFPLITYNSVG